MWISTGRDLCSLRVYVGRVYSLFAFHFLKETVCYDLILTGCFSALSMFDSWR